MVDTKDKKERGEYWETRIWAGKAMNGIWDGNGTWHTKDKTWSGQGTWSGGVLEGTWDVDGNWESAGDDFGSWNGEGKLKCNQGFMRGMERKILIVGTCINVLISLLFKYVGNVQSTTSIIIIVAILILTGAAIWLTRATTTGKLKLKGTWQDEGDSRILDLSGEWKLGYHDGAISGKVKDRKPS